MSGIGSCSLGKTSKPQKKHHYLPRFYLRGFSPNQCAIFQIYKEDSKVIPGTVDSVGYLKNFHTNDTEGVADPQFLEKSLASVEGLQSATLKVVHLNGIRAEETRRDLVDLLAFMRMRIPAVKDHVGNSKQEALRLQLQELERKGLLPTRPTGYEKVLAVENIIIEVSNAERLRVMFKTATNKEILKILYQMRMTLYEAPFGDSFATSDQPVALYHPDPQLHEQGVGPATIGVQVSFPLSSRLLLQLDHLPGPHSELLATSDEVREFNRRTVVMAKKYIFTGDDPVRIDALTEQYATLSAGFMHQTSTQAGGLYQTHHFIPVSPA